MALAADTVALQIAPQSLDAALRAFAEQTGVDLLYAPGLVRGRQTEGLSGTHTADEALHHLLASSGIVFERTADGTYLLLAAETAKPRGENLSTVVVTATRTEREIMDVPASISVVTAEDIARQHVTNPEDVLRSLPGVDVTYLSGPAAAGIPVLRGLGLTFAGTTTQSLLNGMPVEPLAITRRYLWHLVDPAHIERIEVVRGPSSVLYGPGAMGGVINVITKRGSGDPYAQVQMGGGSHNARSVAASAGGSVGDVDVYFGASTYQTDGFKQLTETPAPWEAWYPSGYTDLDGRDGKEKKLNARLTWWASEDTDISAGMSYFENEGAVLGGHPNYRTEQEGTVFDMMLTHRYAGGQVLKAKLAQSDMRAPKRTFDENYWYGDGSLAEVAHDREDENTVSADMQLELHPSSDNTLTLGTTWWDGKYETTEYDPDGTVTWEMQHKSRTYGVFVQDEHRFDRLTVTVGGRYDVYEHYNFESNGAARPDADDKVFTPRVALNYGLRDGLALYASAGTAYLAAPNSLKYRNSPWWLDNPDLKPETATSYEAGVKFRSAGGVLDGSVAVYHTLFKDKIASTQVDTKWQFQNLGETRVRGLELDLNTRLGEYWRPFLNYTYTDSEITKNPSNPAWEGNETANTPKHKFNVGLAYDGPQSVNAQVNGRYVGERYYMDSNADNTKADNHFLVDMKVSKVFRLGSGPEWTASLAVNNAFDGTGYGFWYEKLDGRNYWLEVGAKF
jgi:outer membrane receptor protein involved in Fe transport